MINNKTSIIGFFFLFFLSIIYCKNFANKQFLHRRFAIQRRLRRRRNHPLNRFKNWLYEKTKHIKLFMAIRKGTEENEREVKKYPILPREFDKEINGLLCFIDEKKFEEDQAANKE